MPTVPNRTKLQYFTGSIDLSTDTLRVALYNNSTAYTPDPDTDEFVSDVLDGGTTAQEFGEGTGTGYSRQGLANVSVTQNDTNDSAVLDADDTTFSSLDGADIQGIIIYKQVGGDDTTPTDDPIITIFDDDDLTDLPLTTDGNDVVIAWNTNGIQEITST